MGGGRGVVERRVYAWLGGQRGVCAGDLWARMCMRVVSVPLSCVYIPGLLEKKYGVVGCCDMMKPTLRSHTAVGIAQLTARTTKIAQNTAA